jgi:lycopene cyclase domain-containing protein
LTYSEAVLLAVVGAVVLDLAVLRTRLLGRRAFWTAYAILICFQLVVNGVLTGRRVVVYAPADVLGWRLAFAPVEDLLFGFTLVLTTLSVWVWLGRVRPPDGSRPRG